ncbi:MAG: FHA domain-containing protein [Clostridia bacterium]|nr:FHA domain-containing protein [Clostridia bacterium]
MHFSADKTTNSITLVLTGEDQDHLVLSRWDALADFTDSQAFGFEAKRTPEELSITYFSEQYNLLSNELAQAGTEQALAAFSAFLKFVFEEDFLQSSLASFETVFYDGEQFLFIQPPVALSQQAPELLKEFILGMSETAAQFDDTLKQELLDACESAQSAAPIEAVIDAYTDEPSQEQPTEDISEEEDSAQVKVCPSCGQEYSMDANYCSLCGVQLCAKDALPEQEAIDKPASEHPEETAEASVQEETLAEPAAEQAEQEQAEDTEDTMVSPADETVLPDPESDFGETTLLGFTNYGETSVLGGGMNNFNTPNLVRKATNEKIYITKRSFLIGKSYDSTDYTIADNNAVSRCHAEITVIGNDYFVIDKNSTNHTYVNGDMIQANSSVQVFDGDEIILANEVFVFHLN